MSISRIYAISLLCVTMVTACRHGDGANLAEIARAFPAPAAWTRLEDRTVNDPGCTGDGCRTAVVRWVTGDRPTGAELRALSDQAGWETGEVNACEPRPNVTGPVPFCRLAAKADGADVELTVAGPNPGATPWDVTLRVQ